LEANYTPAAAGSGYAEVAHGRRADIASLAIQGPRLPIERHVRADPHRHARLELRSLGWAVLSGGDAALGFPDGLCASLRHRGNRLDVLRLTGGDDDSELGGAQPEGIRIRVEAATGDHPRAATTRFDRSLRDILRESSRARRKAGP